MFGRLLSTTCQKLRSRFAAAHTRRKHRNRRLCLDALEARQLLAADTFEFFRRTQVTPVGGPIEDTAQPNIASLGDSVFVVGDDYAALSYDNGVQWNPINPTSVFTSLPGGETRWDDSGFSGFQRLATDPVKDMVMWLGTYGAVIDRDNQGNLLYPTAQNGVRLVVARNEAELRDIQEGDTSETLIYDFSIHHLGQTRGVLLRNPQMQVSDSHLYMSADFIQIKPDAAGIPQEYYMRSAWWRVGLDTLQAGGDIERGVTYVTDAGPIGLAYGSDNVMYGATNLSGLSTRIYSWDDNDFTPTFKDVGGLNQTSIDAATSYQQERPNPGGSGTIIVPTWNKVQTGWAANGKVGFMWNSGPVSPPGLGPFHNRPFVRTLIVDQATLLPDEQPVTVLSQPDIFSATDDFFNPAAAVNTRGDLAVVLARSTGLGTVSNEVLIDDGFNGDPNPALGFAGWEHYEAAIGSPGTASGFGGAYFGIMGDESFDNTWIAAGFTRQTTETGAESTPRYYWFGREQDHPSGNLVGQQFDVLQDSARQGDSMDVLYEVLNEGISASGPFSVSFYASDDENITSADHLLGTVEIAGLAAGASTGGTIQNFTLPAADDPFWSVVGDKKFTVGMITDRDNNVPEYDETDNANVGIGIDFTSVFPPDFKDNDIQQTAADVGFLSGLRVYDRLSISPTNDQDWFRAVAPFDGTLNVQIDFTNADGNLQLFVRDSTGALLGQAITTNDTETVTVDVLAGGTYFIQVRAIGSEVNDYVLTTDYRIVPPDARESNNSLQTATDLVDAPQFNESNLTIQQFDDEDFFVFTALADGPFTASATFLSQYGDLDLFLYDQSGGLLDSSTGSGNVATVSASLTRNERYFVQVSGGGEDTNTYRLTYQATTPPVYVSGNTVFVSGTSQNDTFQFLPESPDLFSNTVIVNDVAFVVAATATKYNFRGGPGVNTLIVNGTVRNDAMDASPTTVKLNGYTMNLGLIQNVTLDGQAGNDTIRASGQRAITALGNAGDDLVYGGALGDLLRGGLGNDLVNGGAGDDVLRGELGNDRLIDGSGDDRMTGGQGNDIYVFTSAAATQSDLVEEFALEGVDTLNFAQGGGSVTVDLSSDSALALHGQRTVGAAAAGQSAHVENAVGSSGDDTLLGNNANNLLTGGEGSDHLEGRRGNDSYAFGNPLGAQLDTILEINQVGIDTLNFANSTGPVVADLTLDDATAVQGPRTVKMFAAGQSAFVENLIGGFGSDVLRGNAANNRIEGGDGDDAMEGRAGGDTYFFRNAQTVQVDTVTEIGQPGRDSLDFSGLTNPTVGVTVDLRVSGVTLATHAGRTVNAAAGGQARFFEKLAGGAGEDLLIGNDAINSIRGNGGRDVIVGGVGADTLDAGPLLDQDLLIGGSVVHDLSGMRSIYNEWVRTDLGFDARVQNLRGPTGGLNGLKFLTVDTVFDDFATDILTGGLDRDWFWAANNDTITDQTGLDLVN